jgi:hypothetical protein
MYISLVVNAVIPDIHNYYMCDYRFLSFNIPYKSLSFADRLSAVKRLESIFVARFPTSEIPLCLNLLQRDMGNENE